MKSAMKSAPELGDLRVRRTRKLLWEALMAEMAERPFEQISVLDICERAMVHRTTFYKHYEDKYALLEQGMRQMYTALLLEHQHLPLNSYSVEHPPPYFVRLFEHVAQHERFYRLALGGDGIGRFQRLLRDYFADVVASRMREEHPAADLQLPIAIHAHFLAGAILSLLAWWLERDMPLTPTEMARYLLVQHGPGNGLS
ncbi:MAG TPA: TetR/AcrR family transcriptional regulator [Ktedonobacterales bacterium]|nr:TetR/AcrR family transcriptional regulator [Ktedonobacterales bacterium]